MNEATAADSLGARILSAARLAVAVHLEMDQRESLLKTPKAKAMIGGTDRLVTDDPIPSSVVSDPLSVVDAESQLATDR